MIPFKIIFLSVILVMQGCGTSKEKNQAILALGDSYTIGESVCETCSFPKILSDSLNKISEKEISLKIIAKTGWTTTDLIEVVDNEKLSGNFDLVTLLIGVNNQYQNKAFSLYEKEFPQLLDKAIGYANGKPEKVLVLSIPDYSYTPFGQKSGNGEKISLEIQQYNNFAQKIAEKKKVRFENITPITQEGLNNPDLVAKDGLHPSGLAYQKFVNQIFPVAKNGLFPEKD